MKDFFPRFIMKSKQSGFTYFAFDPEFKTNGIFYTVHSEKKSGFPKPDYPLTKPVINSSGQVISSSHHSVISEWTADNPSANRFSGTFRELLRIEQPYVDHNMGQIAFNPNAQPGDDDYRLLYIAASDGGSDGFPVSDTDPLDMGQDLSTPLGAILRINPQGRNSPNRAYGIPDSNPFVNDDNPNTLGEIWSYGVRNSHRMTWDTKGDGIMLLSEIGQAFVEEINLGIKGSNYGWGEREGIWVINEDNEDVLFPLPANDADFGFTYPVAQYAHPKGPGAIAGGIIYRGSAIPNLHGHFVFADFTTKDTWFHLPVDSLQLGQQATVFELELRHPSNPKSVTSFSAIIGNPGRRTDVRFGVDKDGEILVLSKQDGWVRRLIPLDIPRIPSPPTSLRIDRVVP
jgi:glucose/arabinose dehydrogenase